jgi:hypothetical protein
MQFGSDQRDTGLVADMTDLALMTHLRHWAGRYCDGFYGLPRSPAAPLSCHRAPATRYRHPFCRSKPTSLLKHFGVYWRSIIRAFQETLLFKINLANALLGNAGRSLWSGQDNGCARA